MLERLAHTILRHRKLVVAVWVVLTAIGGFAAPHAANRLLTTFSIPSSQSYQHNQRIVETFGNGSQNPMVLVFHDPAGDVTQAPGIQGAIDAALKQNPGARISSYFNTGADSGVYVSKDGHTMFAAIYPVGDNGFGAGGTIAATQQAIAQHAPSGVQASVSGLDALEQAAGNGASGGPSILVEVAIGALGALIILLFVFGTLPAVAMPLIVAMASILNTFTLILLLTYITDVSVIVEFLVALVGLGVAIDYSLLFIFRFREELAAGRSIRARAGRDDDPRRQVGGDIGLDGRHRAAEHGDPADPVHPFDRRGRAADPDRLGDRRLHAAAGDAGDHRHRHQPGAGDAAPLHLAGRPGRRPVGAVGAPGHPPCGCDGRARHRHRGGGDDPRDLAESRRRAGQEHAGKRTRDHRARPARRRRHLRGCDLPDRDHGAGCHPGPDPDDRRGGWEVGGHRRRLGAAGWSRDGLTVIEAVPATDSASSDAYGAIATLENTTLPGLERQLGGGVSLGTAGGPPQSRDFEHTVYDNFPYLLLFVVVLTYVLLARAFRSLVLALKAVILNLISLTAAYGIIVFIFQQGHGSKPIWNIDPTGVIISWIPLMIFAFLYGISMDYEVFMLTRMREIYDDVGNTNRAIELGLARTGKLVTSAALILMFSFLVLSSSPGVDVKQFGIGLAAGIIFDATVIRALLVPSLMRLMGEWNWWMPRPAARVLFLHPDEPAGATES